METVFRRSLAPVARWWGSFAVPFWRELQRDRATGLAAEVAFFAVLSIFPWLLLVTAALGYLTFLTDATVTSEARTLLTDALDRLFTDQAAGAVEAVRDVFERERIGVLSTSAVVALWASSRAFAAVMVALNIAYDCEERRTWLDLRLRALGLAIGSVLAFSLLLLAFVAGPLLGRGRDIAGVFGAGDVVAAAWSWGRWPIGFLVAVAGGLLVYRVGPCRAHPWRGDVLGASVAALLSIAASLGFGVYLRVAAQGNPVYGALGGGLALLVWIYLLALSLLVGAELNAGHDLDRERSAPLPKPYC